MSASVSPPPRPPREHEEAARDPRFSFGDRVTLQDINLVKDSISNGTYGDLEPARFTEVRDADLETTLAPRVALDSSALASKYRSRLLGVEFPTMVAELLAALVASRRNNNYDTLFRDLSFGVAVAYTVSRESHQDYNTLGGASVFVKFEVTGRTRDNDPTIAAKNNWVVGSNMNSSAVRLAGYLVVECAPRNGFLHSIKSSKGTPFSPKEGGKELERLMREMSTTLVAEDTASLEAFRAEFSRVIRVLDHIWGKSGASLDAARRAAEAIRAKGVIL